MLVCWYISIDMVFDVGSVSRSLSAVWLVVMVIDIALYLNTVKLSNGKSLKTRQALLIEYLQKESYIDLVTVISAIVDSTNPT